MEGIMHMKELHDFILLNTVLLQIHKVFQFNVLKNPCFACWLVCSFLRHKCLGSEISSSSGYLRLLQMILHHLRYVF